MGSLGDVDAVRADAGGVRSLDASATIQTQYATLVTGTLPLMESAFRGEQVFTVGAGEMTVDIGGLEQGLAYHFRVYPWNGVGNVYGAARGCYPAAVVPADPPSPVADVTLLPISDAALRVTWTPPTEDGGVDIAGYAVDLSLAPGTTEVQLVTLNATSSALSGTFCLGFGGYTSSTLPYSASASRVEAALESVPGIGNVVVTQAIVSGTGSYGISWRVQFVDNVGDVALLSVGCNNLVGTGVQLSVTEVVAGVAPSFASPVASLVLARTPTVQTITATASSADLNGVFYITSGGEVSLPIDVYSSAAAVRDVLQAMATMGQVTVTSVDWGLASVPDTDYGRSWAVTFSEPHYESLLVSTDGGSTSDVSASGGSLLGSGALLTVVRTQLEAVPVTVDVPGLVAGSKVVARVAASNGVGVSAASVSALSATPRLSSPQPPTTVSMLPLSATELSVWWTAPAQSGGAAVSGYEVKWDSTASFGPNTNYQFVAGNDTSLVIPSLTPGAAYTVGVAAYNLVGYSAVVLAQVRSADSLPSAASVYSATLAVTAPSAPVGATLVVVSSSELGVLWNPPAYSGGAAVSAYLVEWDSSPYFIRAGQPSYSALVANTSFNASSTAPWRFSYQIAALSAVPIYVRGPQPRDARLAAERHAVLHHASALQRHPRRPPAVPPGQPLRPAQSAGREQPPRS